MATPQAQLPHNALLGLIVTFLCPLARGAPGKEGADFHQFILDSHNGQSGTDHFSWKAQIKTQEEPLKHCHAPVKMYLRVMQGHGLPEFCSRNTREAVSRFDSCFTHIPVSDGVTYQVL